MKNLMSLGAALMLTTTAATAGGIERGGNNYSILFEDGNYVELSFSKVTPDVSGDYIPALGGISTDNMASAYSSLGAALKYSLNDRIDVALFLNQPYGANADYTAGAFTGLTADWDSSQIALVLKYQVNPNVSVYGGARSVESQATIAIPDAVIRTGLAAAGAAGDATAGAIAGTAPAGSLDYTAETEANRQTSFILGAAYERPEIALRVGVTYESGFTHDFATSESLAFTALAGFESTTEIEMPQSITLDFQTGVAADTLVFGSIKWSEWSVWEVRPAGYETFPTGRVTGLDDDVTTFRLGVGRKINDNLSVFGRVTYEDGNGGPASYLSPTDGSTSIGLGGSYTMDNAKITAGIEYAMLGDAANDAITYGDNTALGMGVTVGFSF